MGNYINPKNCTKEEFLEMCGTMLPREEAKKLLPSDEAKRLVCLVSNFAFTAALIVETPNDYEAVFDERDIRQKVFFSVKREDLKLMYS